MTVLEAQLAVARLDVELRVEERGLIVIGPNGAGKTSMLRALLGVLRPERGHVRMGDDVVFDAARGIDVPTEYRRLGYVPQDYALFPHFSAADNVAFGLRGPNRAPRARALLDALGIGYAAERRPTALSGGERQRVALARALMNQPPLLLADEPTGNLDERTGDSVIELLLSLCLDTRTALILVTHNPSHATKTQRVLTLRSGKLHHG